MLNSDFIKRLTLFLKNQIFKSHVLKSQTQKDQNKCIAEPPRLPPTQLL
jgi:hypothetical protein